MLLLVAGLWALLKAGWRRRICRGWGCCTGWWNNRVCWREAALLHEEAPSPLEEEETRGQRGSGFGCGFGRKMEWEQNGCSGLVSKRGGAAAEMKKEGGNSREGELGRLSSLVRESLSGGEGEERDLRLKRRRKWGRRLEWEEEGAGTRLREVTREKIVSVLGEKMEWGAAVERRKQPEIKKGGWGRL
jgi:hypothetical protein